MSRINPFKTIRFRFVRLVLWFSISIALGLIASWGIGTVDSKMTAAQAAAPAGMRLVPEGAFIKGSDDRWPDEGPTHTVYLDSFYIDKYETTTEQYGKFAAATGRLFPSDWKGKSIPPGKEKHPVVFVTWFDANDYCHWAGRRLPTDSEWEKSARGTDGQWFPWGNDFDKTKANTSQMKLGGTQPVGQFPLGDSPYGVSDLSGNVWEWTANWYQPYPGNHRPTENYGRKYRVLKGGSWVNCSGYRCGISAPNFNRSFFNPSTKNKGFGFRCAKSL